MAIKKLFIYLCLAAIALSYIQANPAEFDDDSVVDRQRRVEYDADRSIVSDSEEPKAASTPPSGIDEEITASNGTNEVDTIKDAPWFKFCVDNLKYYKKLQNEAEPQSWHETVTKINDVVDTAHNVGNTAVDILNPLKFLTKGKKGK